MFRRFFSNKPTKYYIICGLGNPGREYAHTRHNVGFDALDLIADRFDIPIDTIRFNAALGKGAIEGRKVILVKPQTYMNLSGESLSQVVRYYKADPESEMIVIYDDIDLPVGRLRIRKQGSAGGHNGMKDIIRHLGTENFARIRIGVGGKPKGYELKDYVLGHFSEQEREQIDEALIHTAGAVCLVLEKGIDIAMNDYNRQVSAEQK